MHHCSIDFMERVLEALRSHCGQSTELRLHDKSQRTVSLPAAAPQSAAFGSLWQRSVVNWCGRSVPYRLSTGLFARIDSASGSNSAVECQLPKLDVAGSIPVSRSFLSITWEQP